MTTVNFYHLTQSSAPRVLHQLLPRALDQRWRVLLRAPSPLLAALDQALWDGAGFLPHGVAGTQHDDDHPILLGHGPSHGFDALALIGTTEFDLAEAPALQRIWVLFDAQEADLVAAARALWKSLAAAQIHLAYWGEEAGKWTKKTEINAPA